MTRRRVAIWTAVLFAASLPAAVANDIAVTDVRSWSLGDVTRVAVETTGSFEYTYESLANPPRIFFDIHEATQRVSKETMHVIEVDDPLIQQIRVSQNRPTVTRVVLDLKGAVDVESSKLANPDRLMIEVRNKGSAPSRVSQQQAAAQPQQAAKASESSSRPATGASQGSSRTGDESPAPSAAPKQSAKVSEPRPAPSGQQQAAKAADPKPATAEPPASQAAKVTEKALEPSAAAPAVAAKVSDPTPEAAIVEAGESIVDERIAKPAKSNKAGGHSLTRVLGLKLGRVVIDPGHGGRDTGTIGPSGLREKDVTLDVAKRLAQLITEGMGSEVILTRTEDESVPLSARTEKANESQADLFVSVHVNSSRYRTVNGVETFYLNLTRSRADLEVAARENAGSDKSIHELTNLVQKIATDDKIQESQDLASSVHNSVYKLHRKYDSKARNRGVKKAPFVVLIGAQMPSVLVELGFISNAREEKLMKKAEYRQELAEAMYEGISSYASSLSHFQVASAGE